MSNIVYRERPNVDNAISLVDYLTAPSGLVYVALEQHEKVRWFDLDLFYPDANAAFMAMKTEGIRATSAQLQKSVREQVAGCTAAPPGEILERTGWTGKHFGYPDGRVISAECGDPPIAFRRGVVAVESRGKLGNWRRQIPKYLRGNHLPIFCILVALAAPLLRWTLIQGNYIVMLTGLPHKGKTTCLDSAASLCGPAIDGSPHGRYYLKFNNTENRILRMMLYYSDMPFIIDELSSLGTIATRKANFRTLVHQIAGVEERGRWGDAPAPLLQTRTIGMVSSNDRLADLLENETEAGAEGVADRVFEIPVPSGAEGAFNALPPDEIVAKRFADEIRERVGGLHGSAMPVFIRYIADLLHRDETGFVSDLRARTSAFARLPDVCALGTISPRALDLFGLFYAAGYYAKAARILPKSVNCAAAVLQALRLHLGQRAEADPLDRLLAWVASQNVVDLRSKPLPSLSDKALDRRGLFVGECRGIPQLWVSKRLFETAFEGSRSLLKQLANRGLLKTEGKKNPRKDIKCQVRVQRGWDRVYAFPIPDLEEWLASKGYAAPKQRSRTR